MGRQRLLAANRNPVSSAKPLGPKIGTPSKIAGRSKIDILGWIGSLGIICAFAVYQTTQIVLVDGQALFLIFNSLTVFTVLALLFMSPYRFFGLVHVFLIYMLVFFGIIPVLELKDGTTYWGAPTSVFDHYGTAAVLAYFGILAFWIAYAVGFRRPLKTEPWHLRSKPNALVLILASVFSALLIYWLNGFSVTSVFYRSGVLESRIELEQTTWLLFQYFVYPTPSVALILYLRWSDRRIFVVTCLAFLTLAANPPTGMPRFQAAAIYIAILLAAVPALIRLRALMFALFVTGLFFLMPVLDKFRRFDDEHRQDSPDFITSGTFDGFQLLAVTIYEGTITYGYQLLGALLFFVPRSTWPEKPVSSGTLLANRLHFDWDNVASSLLAEGYINFGITGTFLFMVFAGYFCSRYDRYFLASPHIRTVVSAYYPLFLGMFFFLLRGSLQNGIAYSLGAFVTFFFLTVASTHRVYRTDKTRLST